MNLSSASMTVDQMEPVSAICKEGREKGRRNGRRVWSHQAERCGKENVDTVRRRKRESNTANIVTRERKDALRSTRGKEITKIVAKLPLSPKMEIIGMSQPSTRR